MEDDLLDTIRYAMAARRKRSTNEYYGRSVVETISQKNGSTIQFDRSTQKKRFRGTITDFTFVPGTYDSPWDAEICRKWEGRAEEFWDARLSGRLQWEWEKNGSTRND